MFIFLKRSLKYSSSTPKVLKICSNLPSDMHIKKRWVAIVCVSGKMFFIHVFIYIYFFKFILYCRFAITSMIFHLIFFSNLKLQKHFYIYMYISVVFISKKKNYTSFVSACHVPSFSLASLPSSVQKFYSSPKCYFFIQFFIVRIFSNTCSLHNSTKMFITLSYSC